MPRRRGIQLDVEFKASARRHHDWIRARLRLRLPRSVGEGYAIETHDLDRNTSNATGAVDVGEVQAHICVCRRIGETPKLFAPATNGDFRHPAGRIESVADRNAVDAQERFLLRSRA